MFKFSTRLLSLAALLFTLSVETSYAQQSTKLCGDAVVPGRPRVLIGSFLVTGDRNNAITKILDKIFVGVTAGLFSIRAYNVSLFVWDGEENEKNFPRDAPLIERAPRLANQTELRTFLANNNCEY